MEMAQIPTSQLVLAIENTPAKGSSILFQPAQIQPGGPISQNELNIIIARYNQVYAEYGAENSKIVSTACMMFPFTVCCICCCGPCLVGKYVFDNLHQGYNNFITKVNALTAQLNQELAPRSLVCVVKTEKVGQYNSYQNGRFLGSVDITAYRLEFYFKMPNGMPTLSPLPYIQSNGMEVYPQAQPGMISQ